MRTQKPLDWAGLRKTNMHSWVATDKATVKRCPRCGTLRHTFGKRAEYKRPGDAKYSGGRAPACVTRANPRQIDADEDIRIDVFMEDDATGAWVKEATCTLADFFRENETVTRKEVRPLLFMRGQFVGGGGASARWKIAFAK